MTWVGFALSYDTHSQIGKQLKGRTGIILDLDEGLAYELTQQLKSHSGSFRGYLERASCKDGQSGVVYITTIRPDNFVGGNLGIAICKTPMDKSFEIKCLQLPGMLKSLMNTNNIYDVGFWNVLLKSVGELFGRNVFPLGPFGGDIRRTR